MILSMRDKMFSYKQNLQKQSLEQAKTYSS